MDSGTLPLPSISLFKRGLDFASPRFRIRRSLERIFRVDVHSGKKVAPLHGVPSCFHETRAVWCLCSWQDMRAMHDLGVSDGKGNPSWHDYRSVYSQMAVCRAYWIHGVQILPKPAHFGYTAAICCHGGVFSCPKLDLEYIK